MKKTVEQKKQKEILCEDLLIVDFAVEVPCMFPVCLLCICFPRPPPHVLAGKLEGWEGGRGRHSRAIMSTCSYRGKTLYITSGPGTEQPRWFSCMILFCTFGAVTLQFHLFLCVCSCLDRPVAAPSSLCALVLYNLSVWMRLCVCLCVWVLAVATAEIMFSVQLGVFDSYRKSPLTPWKPPTLWLCPQPPPQTPDPDPVLTFQINSS